MLTSKEMEKEINPHTVSWKSMSSWKSKVKWKKWEWKTAKEIKK